MPQCFICFGFFPVQKKRVALISMHNADFHDGLGEVERAFQGKRKAIFLPKSRAGIFACKQMRARPPFLRSVCRAIGFFTRKAYGLARSRYIFLNDNLLPLASLAFG